MVLGVMLRRAAGGSADDAHGVQVPMGCCPAGLLVVVMMCPRVLVVVLMIPSVAGGTDDDAPGIWWQCLCAPRVLVAVLMCRRASGGSAGAHHKGGLMVLVAMRPRGWWW